MTKKAGNSLQAILNRASAEAAPVEEAKVAAPKRTRARAASPVAAEAAPARPVQKGREGLKLIGGHFRPEISQQLRILAVEEDTTVQALLEEAITDLLTKKAARKVGR